jgi:hypothetical protein
MPCGIQQYIFLLTKDAQELMPYRSELKPSANRIRKDFVYADARTQTSWTNFECIYQLRYPTTLLLGNI